MPNNKVDKSSKDFEILSNPHETLVKRKSSKILRLYASNGISGEKVARKIL